MDELRELLSCPTQLVHSIMRFNCMPASYLHPMRRDEFAPELPSAVWETPSAWAKLSAVILGHANFSDYIFEPNHWGWSIALLSIDRLKLLARYSGAIALLDKVRSSLARDHVLSWKKLLGEDAYQFAMTTAPLLPNTRLHDIEERDSSPEKIGYSVIMAVFKSMPDPMCFRCQLKIPSTTYSSEIDPLKARRLLMAINQLSRI